MKEGVSGGFHHHEDPVTLGEGTGTESCAEDPIADKMKAQASLPGVGNVHPGRDSSERPWHEEPGRG